MDRKIELLVLDDEEIVCARLKPILEKAGYSVETFTKSLDAQKRLEEKRFDIVVTDLKMADIDGLELFRFAKDRWPETEVILISGFATVDITRKALQSGVRDIIPKPFKIAQLRELLDKISTEIKDRSK